MAVPSNLIPTRITQLPIAPVASENSILLIVYDGVSYQIRAGDLLAVAGVPTSRQVIAGTGLTGGGQLVSNVTLSVANNGIGPAQIAPTGVTPGTYGDATNIPVFTVDEDGRVEAAGTVPVVVSGYVPVSREVIAGTGLSGGGPLNANVTLSANFNSATPQPNANSGNAGVANTAARGDHAHPAVDLASGAATTGVLPVSRGGTGRSIVPAPGAVVYSGADGLYVGPVGVSGQVLISDGTSGYSWGSALIVSDQPANYVYAGPTAGPDAPTTFRALVNADLPNSAVTPGTYGAAASIPVITVDSKGVVTGVSTQAVAASWALVTGKPTTLAGYGITDAVPDSRTITAGTGLTGGGDLTANRTLAIANTGVGAGSYGAASKTLTLSVNAQGQLTAVSEQPIAIANTQVSGLGTASTLNAGVAGGVATLDGSGTVPTSQLPAAVLGALKYQGVWNASTNTPTLASSVGTQGYYYVVDVAGTTNLNGITDWQVGDWAIYNGTAWQKVDNTDAVTSVNGYTGTVVLSAADVGAPTTTGTGASGTWAIAISGNAATATALQTARTINGVSFNGTADITLTAATPAAATFDSSGAGAASGATFDGSTARTISYNTVGASPLAGSTSFTTAGTITTGTWNATPIGNSYLANSSITINGSPVSLGGSTTVTAATPNALTFNNGGAGAASGTTFNGSAAQTISYNTLGAPSATGTGASGTWSISINGNAATATSATSATTATTANAVANAVTFAATGGAAAGTTFNGSVARTIDYSSVGAPKADGTGASGTWAINISGNAATATSATSATTASAVANAVTFAASGGAAPGTTFNGSVARTVDYSSVGAPSATGTGASGTWSINITGDANYATTAGNAATVTNGVYTTGSYANPAWITSLAGSKITGQLTNGISGGTF